MNYLSLINLDDRNFVNNLLKNIELLDQYDDLEEEFYSQFRDPKNQIVRIFKIKEFTYILHLTSTKVKDWRVTTLMNDLPMCHTEFKNYIEALKYLISEIGYKNFFNQ
ncbi:Uncharacterised protein [Fusobacterium necrogenes]|uniref:Uncharacterized protein n=1 Tax=Fusobacterium necrogenes TaxID=858 RepID=A0A377GPP0_9FUSO|nr:hypothetical protein [Fusobacterium necrogenes]STO28753.1 Uncharacterised protein [Fusobacterium necrogenes]